MGSEVRVKPSGPFPVGSKARFTSAAVVRPADTNAYAAGDVVAATTTATLNTNLRFPLNSATGSGWIMQARLVDSAGVTPPPDLQLWLFDSPVAMDADNAAFTPTDDEMERMVAIIAFPTGAFVVGDATSGAGGNVVCDAQALWIPFALEADKTMLYGVLVVRNAYVPVSAEKFTVRLTLTD